MDRKKSPFNQDRSPGLPKQSRTEQIPMRGGKLDNIDEEIGILCEETDKSSDLVSLDKQPS